MDGFRNANYRVTTAAISPGVVGGRLERAQALDGPALVGLGTMVDFAEFLTLEGCRTMFNGNAVASVSHVSAHVVASSSARSLSGECQVSSASPGICLAEVGIWDDDVGRIALITQTISVRNTDAPVEMTRPVPGPDELGVRRQTVARAEPMPVRVGDHRIDIPAIRRRQIFEAATRIITEKGFERTTMREIAREAGLTIPTMYQYVRAKDGILELIFDSYLTKMEDGLRSAVAGRASATEQLTAAVSATLSNLSAYYREVRIMTYDTKSLRPEILEVVLRRMMNYLSIFTEIVAAGVASGEFRQIDPELFANLVPMMCQVWVQRYWSVGKFGLPAVERAILQLALEGLRNPGHRT